MIQCYDMEPQRLFIQLNNNQDTINQEPNDRLADDRMYIEGAGGEPLLQKQVEKAEVLSVLKYNLVCRRVKE